jgi:hypothetical protein
MSTPINDGGPAFPRPATKGSSGSIIRESQNGMTLRDWFAGQALAGFCAAPRDRRNNDNKVMATGAYTAADAMLAAREGKQ